MTRTLVFFEPLAITAELHVVFIDILYYQVSLFAYFSKVRITIYMNSMFRNTIEKKQKIIKAQKTYLAVLHSCSIK